MADEKELDVINEEENSEEESVESGITPSLQDTEISKEVQSSFLDYAMSVIVSRAIPDVRDGLKPVHRRVVYGMYNEGYTNDRPFVKSARVVGDVMGKYHPHGDAAIYSTIVRLAQPFSMRYPLVSGHGNFGDMDGDEAAAMRYTECRMDKIALEMVKDIDCDTVPFVPNYDGSLEEPAVLPARLPNLLINGSDGIAVGMATKMPPHNLSEVIDGIVAYAHNQEITIEELMKYIKAPDFPTGGILFGLSGVREAYTRGRGSFKLRGKCEIKELHSGKSQIIITEIPYQVNKANLVSKIGELAREKTIDGITGIRDLSKTDVKIEIDLRKDVIPQVVLNQLYKNTQLEINYGIINLCIVDGAPKVLSLKEIIKYYFEHQIDVLVRRTNFLKKKDEDRLHIVEGLLLVRDHIDEIVEMAKTSQNTGEFQERLIERFNLSEVQAKAVVAMTLGRLTGLETQKLIDEKNQLLKNIEEYNRILSNREHQKEIVVNELLTVKSKFGDERRTEISSAIVNIDDEDLIPEEDIVITLTEKGYIKRMSSDEFRTQRRGGTGVKGMTVYEDDEVLSMTHASTHTDILFFTNLGRVYRKRGHEIVESSRQGKGIPVLNIINLEKDEKVITLLGVDDYKDKYLFFTTIEGVVKRTELSQFERINCNGKYAITFKDGDRLLDVKITDGSAKVGIATSAGMMCLFEEEDVRAMGRNAAGVRGIKLKKGGKVVGLDTSLSGNKVLVLSEKGLGKLSPLEDYRLTNRGAGGVITIKITERTGSLIGMKIVNGDEDLVVITNNGTTIRLSLSQVSEVGRNAQGVKIINLREGEQVSSMTIVPKQEVEEFEEENSEVSEEKPE